VSVHAILAQAHGGGGGDGLWDPKLKGYLTVIMAVGLFCGSVYLLMWTNMGSSQAFLVSASAIFGIMMILSTLWVTGEFHQAYKGRQPAWKLEEVLPAGSPYTDSSVGKVRDLDPVADEATTLEEGQIRPDLEHIIAGAEAKEGAKLFDTVEDFDVVTLYKVGGERKMPIWWSKKPGFAAAEVCTRIEVPPDFNEVNNPPFPRTCDETIPNQVVVLYHDLGSDRLWSGVVFIASTLMFGATLYLMYVLEIRQRQAKAALVPVAATAVEAKV
jgi:hypothetical protein